MIQIVKESEAVQLKIQRMSVVTESIMMEMERQTVLIPVVRAQALQVAQRKLQTAFVVTEMTMMETV